MATHSSILPGASHGQKSLSGFSPQGCTESDMTEATWQEQPWQQQQQEEDLSPNMHG